MMLSYYEVIEIWMPHWPQLQGLEFRVQCLIYRVSDQGVRA